MKANISTRHTGITRANVNGLKMYTFKRGDGGVGLTDVEWCECSAVVEEGRVANVRG